MGGFGLKALAVLLLLVVFLMGSGLEPCSARRGKHWRTSRASYLASIARKKAKWRTWAHHHGGPFKKPKAAPPAPSPEPSPAPARAPGSPSRPSPEPAPAPASHYGKPNVFDVLAFGAKGDGVTDDTKAFMAAWAVACKVEGSTVYVPEDYDFLVGPISFSGPYCQPNIVFQLDGTIVAPTSAKAWGLGLLQWIEFTKLKGITIRGKGVVEGRGAVWWSQSEPEFDPIAGSLFGAMPSIKPTAVRFYGSEGVTVTGISIVNSPQCHLKFDNCAGVQVYNLSISSPANSLNTDGIHLQNSRDVSIHHTSLSCGDDCVSIQTGCANVNIESVNCGPGHGISIGGLGRDDTKACVSNITVQNVNMQGTMTGVRIKTWQGGSGSVQNVRFSNIRMAEVQTPIVIDQFYCDRASCRNQTAAVALSGISYENIKGTYTVKPLHLACSDSLPCWDIRLTNIELKPLPERFKMFNPFCWQTFGQLLTPSVPPIDCLMTGKPTTSRTMADLDAC
ncbi:polygalacturonase At1g48100-like [Wolffia australiana]